MESETYSYCYVDEEQKREQLKSEVQMHIELRIDAYDRYMDKLLESAAKYLTNNDDDPQTEDKDE
ncbi:hypothetical protein KFK09_028073 [Dendrobium nobile]|uniref:Uncharacterized protein n=1 Tax=Dendrobium nobile TaxID=94219 RepID=A0A8T3A1R3_DENNO|nr:hypothetical protein KFK09_028073 [Dendrobium nobile]